MVLSNIFNRCPDEIFERLVRTQKHKIESSGIEATRLCTHRENAEQINIEKMKTTKGDYCTFSEFVYSLSR